MTTSTAYLKTTDIRTVLCLYAACAESKIITTLFTGVTYVRIMASRTTGITHSSVELYTKCQRCKEVSPIRPVRGRVVLSLSCGHQFSVTVGTPLDKIHSDVERWIEAYLLLKREPKTTASDLMRYLNVKYATAWTIRKKIVDNLEWFDTEIYKVAALRQLPFNRKPRMFTFRIKPKK